MEYQERINEFITNNPIFLKRVELLIQNGESLKIAMDKAMKATMEDNRKFYAKENRENVLTEVKKNL